MGVPVCLCLLLMLLLVCVCVGGGGGGSVHVYVSSCHWTSTRLESGQCAERKESAWTGLRTVWQPQIPDRHLTEGSRG